MQCPRLRPILALVIACMPGAALAIDPARTTSPPAAAPATVPATAPAPTTTPAPAPAPAASAPPAGSPATAAAAAGDDDEAAMKAPPPKATGATPQKFNPTEKVRADYPVAFPIDI